MARKRDENIFRLLLTTHFCVAGAPQPLILCGWDTATTHFVWSEFPLFESLFPLFKSKIMLNNATRLRILDTLFPLHTPSHTALHLPFNEPPLFDWDKDGNSFDIEKLLFDKKYESLESIGNSGSNAKELLTSLKEINETFTFLDIPSIFVASINGLGWHPKKSSYKHYPTDRTLSIVKGSLLYIHSRLKEKFLSDNDKEIIVLEAIFFFLFHGQRYHIFIVKKQLSCYLMLQQFSRFAGNGSPSLSEYVRIESLTKPSTLNNFISKLTVIHEQQDVEHLAMVIRLSPSHAIGRMSFDLTRYIALFLHNDPNHSLYHSEFRL